MIATRGDILRKSHDVTQAEYGRDAFAKAVYERLFTWIITKINRAIIVPGSDVQKRFNRVIGVLDIYGFEIFDQNNFEQFCINYCNEKLQQLFIGKINAWKTSISHVSINLLIWCFSLFGWPTIELVLKQEQEEYNREGIEWKNIDYFNNQIICDLVEQPHKGLISILDEACLTVGKITDETLLEAMDKKLVNHPHYSSRQLKPMDKELRHKVDFRITWVFFIIIFFFTFSNFILRIRFILLKISSHYAGDVIYTINGFIDKNKDTLFQDFRRLLFNSNCSILSEMWPEGSQDISKTTKRPLTAGTLFKTSMIDLVQQLLKKEPFYVRCIKPNDIKSPSVFDDVRIDHQVRYLGLLENVRVRRAGFVHRQRYDKFLLRYKMISMFTWPNFRGGSDMEGVSVLVNDAGYANDVKFGHTKIFIRSPQTLFALERKRNQQIPGIVIFLQKQLRGWICRQKYKKMKAAIKIIQYYR